MTQTNKSSEGAEERSAVRVTSEEKAIVTHARSRATPL